MNVRQTHTLRETISERQNGIEPTNFLMANETLLPLSYRGPDGEAEVQVPHKGWLCGGQDMLIMSLNEMNVAHSVYVGTW